MSLNRELSINLGLPEKPLTQQAELFMELNRVYNAIRAVASALDKYTGVLNDPEEYWSQTGINRCTIGMNARIYVEAAVDLSYGNLLGLDSNGKAIKAVDGTVKCVGFCRAPNGTLTGDTTEMQLLGLYPPFSVGTLTPGEFYYNSSTAGSVGVKAAAATWEQCVGFAITDQHMYFNPQYQIYTPPTL